MRAGTCVRLPSLQLVVDQGLPLRHIKALERDGFRNIEDLWGMSRQVGRCASCAYLWYILHRVIFRGKFRREVEELLEGLREAIVYVVESVDSITNGWNDGY